MEQQAIEITAELIEEEEGGYTVYSPELDIYTQGEDTADALSNLKEAAELHIEEVGILGKAGITIERLEEGGHIMTVQEKLERLKREKTAHSTGELDRLGWARYAEIRSQLEDQHHGAYVMIEVDSGDYFVGETPQVALCQARAAYPGKAFYLIRIGYKAVHKLKRT